MVVLACLMLETIWTGEMGPRSKQLEWKLTTPSPMMGRMAMRGPVRRAMTRWYHMTWRYLSRPAAETTVAALHAVESWREGARLALLTSCYVS
jgi:hypothetical protein